MKRKFIVVTAMCIIAVGGCAQQIISSKTKTHGQLLWGLHKWGNHDSIKHQNQLSRAKAVHSLKKKVNPNDSLEVKSTLWGAIQWTEKKKKSKKNK